MIFLNGNCIPKKNSSEKLFFYDVEKKVRTFSEKIRNFEKSKNANENHI